MIDITCGKKKSLTSSKSAKSSFLPEAITAAEKVSGHCAALRSNVPDIHWFVSHWLVLLKGCEVRCVLRWRVIFVGIGKRLLVR